MCQANTNEIWNSRERAKKWKWDRVISTDFSGKFTLQPFHNRRNDGIWAEEGEEMRPLYLIHAPTNKFQKGIIFGEQFHHMGSFELQLKLILPNGCVNNNHQLEQVQECI
jgi:hypothetical protein